MTDHNAGPGQMKLSNQIAGRENARHEKANGITIDEIARPSRTYPVVILEMLFTRYILLYNRL